MKPSEKEQAPCDAKQNTLNHTTAAMGSRIDTPTRLVEALVMLARKKEKLTANPPNNLNDKVVR